MCEVLVVVVHLWLLLLLIPCGSKFLQQGEEVDYSSKSHNHPCDATDTFCILLSSSDWSSAFVSSEFCSLGLRMSFPM